MSAMSFAEAAGQLMREHTERAFDRRSPAPGVRVLGVYKPKVHGLSESQRKGTKRATWDTSVMRPIPQCVPVGLGVASTAHTSQHALRKGDVANCPEQWNSVLPTTGTDRRLIRPGTRRRSPKPGPQNLACVRALPTQVAYFTADLAHRMADLRRLWHAINKQGGNKRLEELYEGKRAAVIRLYEYKGIDAVHKLEG